MIAPATAQSASEALWLAIVELAETANDQVIRQQRDGAAAAARNIAAGASDLAALAAAAAVLGKYVDHASLNQTKS